MAPGSLRKRRQTARHGPAPGHQPNGSVAVEPGRAVRLATRRRDGVMWQPLSDPWTMSQPGVGDQVEHVSHETPERDGDARDECARDHDGVVTGRDGLDGEASEPGPREDLLDKDCPGAKARQRQAEQGDHRERGVPQSVSHDHRPFGHPLSPGRAEVVVPCDVEQCRALKAGHERSGQCRECHCGEDEVPDPIDERRPGCEIRVHDRIHDAAGREDRHPIGEDEEGDLRQPEVGQCSRAPGEAARARGR